MAPASPPPDAPPDARRVRIETPSGQGWADLRLPPRRPLGVVALGHGAGGTVGAPDLASVAAACVGAGLAVAAITQPYRVAGRGVAATGALDAAWLAIIGALREEPELRGPRRARVPWVFGGRSSGARVACRTASAAGAAGVLALAFPLHPPGRPDRSRQPELDGVGAPVLVVQGSRDPFGMPAPDPARGRAVEVIEGADHGLKRELERIGRIGADFASAAIAAAAPDGRASNRPRTGM